MADVALHELIDTWDDVGVTYTAIEMDVTNTASAAGSMLLDMQIDSASIATIFKTGQLKLAVDSYGLLVGAGGDAEIYYDGTNMILKPATVGSGGVKVLSTDESIMSCFRMTTPI